MWKIREIADKVTNVVMNYTEVEAKVREATNDDAWGPTGQLMQEIAQSTFTYEHFPEVMGMLWKRMLHDRNNCRRVYKSLLLLGYLVRNGSERVVTSAREHIYDLRSLENYTMIDELGKDQGINVRQRVRDLIEFIQDDDKLREERKKAKKARDKYVGLSSETLGIGRYNDRFDEPAKSSNDFQDFVRGGRLRFGLGRRRSFEDSPEHSNDEDRKSENDERFEYRDDEKDSQDSKDSKQNNKRTEKTKNANKNNRKIDLGAAATFGKDSNSTHSTPEKSSSLVDTSPASPKPPPTLESDLLSGASPVPPSTEGTSNGDFADFTQFKSATDQNSQDDFADFSSFSSAPPPVAPSSNSASVNLLDLSSSSNATVPPLLPPSGISPLQPMPSTTLASPLSPPSASQTSVMSPPGGVYHPIIGGHVAVVRPPLGSGTLPVAANLGPTVIGQPQMNSLPSCNPFPVNMAGNGSLMQPSSLPPMSNTAVGSQHSSNFANFQRNTWSDAVGSVNISVDNLSLANRYDRPTPPSMNQLAGQNLNTMNMINLSLGIQQLSLNQQANPLTGDIRASTSPVGMLSPPGMVVQQRPVYNNPGTLGM